MKLRTRIVTLTLVLGFVLGGASFGLATTPGHAAALTSGIHGPTHQKTATTGCGDGTWPWVGHPEFLNRFNDHNSGNGYCIAPNAFGNNYTFQPDASHTVYMESDVTITGAKDRNLKPDAILPPGAIFQEYTGCNTLTVNGTWTIKQDAFVELYGGTGCYNLHVYGTLNTTGASGHPVTFTVPPGFTGWYGMAFESGSDGTLTYATIENTVGQITCGGNFGPGYAAIVLCGGNPTFKNSTFQNGASMGINSGVPTLISDTFNNASTGRPILFGSVPTTINMSGLKAINNGNNSVDLGGGTFTGTGTWSNPGIPLISYVNVVIAAGSRLTIAAGVDLMMSSEGFYDFLVLGTLNLAGTPAAPIVFDNNNVGFEATNVQFEAGSSGTLNHVTFDFSRARPVAAIIVIGGNPLIENVTTLNAAPGVQINGGSPTVTAGTFSTGAGNYAVDFPTTVPTAMRLSKLKSTGPGYNVVGVGDSYNTFTYSGNGTWSNPGIPIQLDSPMVVASGSQLAVSAGTTLGAYNAAKLEVQGGLIMKGSPTKQITLTDLGPTPYNGGGVVVVFDAGSAGNLTWVNDLYAGNSNEFRGCHYPNLAALNICGGSPIIQNTTFANSAYSDVTVDNGATPTLRYDTFGAVSGGWYGVLNYGWTSGQPVVDATHSSWGDPSGPYDPIGNPNGKGSPVSTGVSYTPWLALTLSSTSGPPSSSTTVTGGGYQAGETVTILWNCSLTTCGGAKSPTLATVVADSSGNFSTLVTIPGTATPGTYSIAAFGNTSNAFDTAPFTVTP